MVRREHRPEARGDDIELASAKGSDFRVAFDPFEIDARLARSAPAGVEVLGRDIRRDDDRPRLCGPDGDIARAGGDVEHPLTRRNPARV